MIFDGDYYERGLETGKSCYQNYRWIPELTMSMAMTIIDYLNIKPTDSILEIGCAKGYLVKAFRLLRRQAYGIDISEYAITNVDNYVRDYCYLGNVNGFTKFPFPNFNFCIAKDVFEHIEKQELLHTLNCIPAKTLFVVVPLGDGKGKYIAPNNDLDKTHIICEPMHWWIQLFDKTNWVAERTTFKISGIKDAYYESYPKAHGFFMLRKV
jgi:SAM-dependent methyltransferase